METSRGTALLGRQIRILVLEPGSRESAVLTSLQVVNLDDNSIWYNALSYCWEDQQPSLLIQCDDVGLLVTQNVYEALITLRSLSKAVHLWIDQMCINQCDIEERNHQVSMMADVYQKARKVIVWLGQEDEDTRTGFEALSHFARVGKHNLTPSQTRAIARKHQQQPPADTPAMQPRLQTTGSRDTLEQMLASLPMIQSAEWKSLLSVLSRSWFGRMWTFQEAALGNRLTEFRCGRCTTGPRVLGRAISAMRDCGYVDAIGFSHSAATAAWIVGHVQSLRSNLRKPQGEPTLASLLDATHKLRCKDPHDKVYAVLGLCDTGHRALIKIDYNQSLAELYGTTVRASISVAENLSILSQIRGWEDENVSKPFWIPDLDDSRQAYGFLFGLRRNRKRRCYSTCRALSPALLPSTDPSCLNLRGIRFRKVTRLARLVLPPYRDVEGWHTRFRVGAQGLGVPRRYALTDTNTSVLSNDYLTYTDGISTQSVTGENFLAATLRRVLTADVYPHGDKQRLNNREQRTTFPAFHAWRNLGFPGEVPIDVLREHTAWEHRVMRSRFVCVLGEEPDDAHLCVAPGSTKIGDWVCVLSGGDAPFVLRERSVSAQNGVPYTGTRWQLVGDCYVDGIMDGEALEGKENDDFETFVLV